ncbi:MAG: asparagine synthase (glutamine-hydrolyzing) [Flavobacteriaceae bacterium]|nr:asparagine synthase (glutamine-hydrolyzing) [Flavobacteriaceae bacterium]
MCGIAGIIEFYTAVNQVAAIKNMTQSMQNRGPDDEGFLLCNNTITPYFGDNSYKNRGAKAHINTAENIKSKIIFGFKRLSIIDLSDNGHQPMCDSSKKYWIVFNGEIYNYKEIRRELISLNHTFHSNSDTEVVLKSYIEWGEKALQKFNGMFAFAIYNSSINEIFMARDRVGIKPFYYFKNNDRFVFGSTIKSIIDSKLYQPEINWKGLWQNFTFSIAQRPNTCFANIAALEPGHFFRLNVTTGKINKTKYWDIPTGAQDFSLSEKNAKDLLEDALYKSVKYRLNADVEVGTFMSGGIDSTTISAIASKLQPNIKAFTLGFNQNYEEYNEVRQATETAKRNQIDHIIHYAKPRTIIDNIDTIVTGYEEPYHHLPANYIMSKIVAKHGVKVVLNGLGGDELFAGYHFYTKLKKWHLLKKLRPVLSVIPNSLGSRIYIAKQMVSYNNIPQYYTHFRSTFNDSDNKSIFKDCEFSSLNTLENLYQNERDFTDDIEALSYYDLKSYIGNHQTRTIDQFTMNFSIEGRFPFLDHKVIELAFKIPSKYKIKNSVQKYILKEVAKTHIAPSCFKMNKKGFGLPLEYWYKNELKEFISDNITSLKNRQLFNNIEIDDILKTDNVRKIWHLVMTEQWLQKFFN